MHFWGLRLCGAYKVGPCIIAAQRQAHSQHKTYLTRSYQRWRHQQVTCVLQPQCSGPKRFTSLCKPMSRPYGTDPNISGQKRATRAITLGLASGIITGMGILFFQRYYYQRKKRHSKPTDSELTYDDPDFGKNGRMIYVTGYLLPEFAVPSLQGISALSVREEDVFVCSFPKSGTTWVQYIIQLLEQECGVQHSATHTLEEKFPYLEYIYPGLEDIKNRKGPRHIKTHLPYELLPSDIHQGKGRVIYITRNPKDVSVSYFHFARMLSELNYNKDFHNFFEKFVSNRVAYGPWSKHVTSFWQNRTASNVLFLKYEELHKDPVQSVRTISQFLGLSVDESTIKRVCVKSRFSEMEKNPKANYSWWNELGLRKKNEAPFLRKGCVGDWKKYYTPEMEAQINRISTSLQEQGLDLQDSLD